MYFNQRWMTCLVSVFSLVIGGCAGHINQTNGPAVATSTLPPDLPLYHGQAPYYTYYDQSKYVRSLPSTVQYGHEKVIVVDPAKFAWAAYDENGQFVHGGIAQAGADYCPDEGRPCRTSVGTFRVYSLGDEKCVSRTYPIGQGGSYMPYCMFFHNGESLHGTPDQMLSEANTSHGCVHMRIPDVQWLRYNFVKVGTKVVILPYGTTSQN